MSCPRVGHVCTHAGPLQAMYNSIILQKNEKKQQSSIGRDYWYGIPTSLNDIEAHINS